MTLEQRLAAEIDKMFERLLFGPPRWQPQTALRVRGGMFETVQLDDAGNVIEPCRQCGPVMLCSKHLGC